MTTDTTTAPPAEPETYMTADESGNGWRLMLGDSCERLAELPTFNPDDPDDPDAFAVEVMPALR